MTFIKTIGSVATAQPKILRKSNILTLCKQRVWVLDIVSQKNKTTRDASNLESHGPFCSPATSTKTTQTPTTPEKKKLLWIWLRFSQIFTPAQELVWKKT